MTVKWVCDGGGGTHVFFNGVIVGVIGIMGVAVFIVHVGEFAPGALASSTTCTTHMLSFNTPQHTPHAAPVTCILARATPEPYPPHTPPPTAQWSRAKEQPFMLFNKKMPL